MIIPNDMISAIGVIFEGEYDIPYFKKSPIILDIGANVGGFAIWANKRWENSTIFCYEPVKNTYKLLEENTKDIDKINCYNYAIGDTEEEKFIFYGQHNIGQSSFLNTRFVKSHGEFVSIKSANTLPKADIVKIDTEGYETNILNNMIIEPDVIMIEYHSCDGIENHMRLSKNLNKYVPYSIDKRSNYCGIIKYFHKNYSFEVNNKINNLNYS
jgi:FkbM family methyltransferase